MYSVAINHLLVCVDVILCIKRVTNEWKKIGDILTDV